MSCNLYAPSETFPIIYVVHSSSLPAVYKVSSTSNGNNSSHQVATSTYNTTSTDQHQADTRTRPSDLPGGELNNGSNGGYHLHPATLESQLSTPATPGSSEFMRLLPPATPPSSSHYALQSIPNEEPQYATCATTVLQNDLTNRPPLEVGVGRNDGFPHPSSSSIDVSCGLYCILLL